MKRIYIDHNATTPVHPEVLREMLPFLKENFGNPSSIHWFGQQAHNTLENAREQVASLFNAETAEIFFTSGGTESDNLAIKGAVSALRQDCSHIVTSQIEHHAVLNTCKYLEEGLKVTYLPVDKYGIVKLGELEKTITANTILVTIMFANNETGAIQPIEDICKIIQSVNNERSKISRPNVVFHTDAVQAVGKLPIDLKQLEVDLLSLSAHKINGPKGIGALYIRKGTKMQPLLHGGHHEKNMRAGTENIPGIVALGKACEIAKKTLEKEAKHLAKLRNKLWKGISEKIEHVNLNGLPEKCLPNTLNVSFEFIEGESMLLNLDLKGIAASAGSACTSGSMEPSHVLSAMGVDPVKAQGSLRFSLGLNNTEEEIDYIVETLPGIVKKLRAMSPIYKNKKK
ncbi:MAG: cysteine desulfurase NifS [Elusimicrobia bacterium]|nr:cysteine desulfurase NifS [Elusimicrobiota bacterium]MBU2614795.1 cysteine desulfurase NifS [Elusimicrobiota bacterium]